MNNKKKEFEDRIAAPESNLENLMQVKQRLDKTLHKVSETYLVYNTRENVTRLDNTIGGIFLSLKNVLPKGVHARIDYRTKSSRSGQITATLEMFEPASKITKDIFAMKIIIDKIDGRLKLDETNSEYQKILELDDMKFENIKFIEDVREWLSSSSTDTLKTEEQYYENLIALLKRLENSTYRECKEELEDEVSYHEKLQKAERTVAKKKLKNRFESSISDDQIAEMDLLLDELEERLDDKLQRRLLNVFVPKALQSNLVSNMLLVNYHYDKEKLLPNGYVADFYNLTVGNAFSLELQTQSELRYWYGMAGPAHHNNKPGKNIDSNKLFSFFELTDPNDEHDAKYYLEILNKMYFSNYEKAISEGKSSTLLNTLEEAYDHIKIKDTFSYGDTTTSMNDYLITYAEHISPDMKTCRSARSFGTPTASIKKKGLAFAFADVLRKKDGIDCLSQLLVDRVNEIVTENDSYKRFRPEEKEVNTRDIIAYAKMLPENIIKEDIDR